MIMIWMITIISVPTIIIWRSCVRSIIVVPDCRIPAIIDFDILAVIYIDIDIVIPPAVINVDFVATVIITAHLIIITYFIISGYWLISSGTILADGGW